MFYILAEKIKQIILTLISWLSWQFYPKLVILLNYDNPVKELPKFDACNID